MMRTAQDIGAQSLSGITYAQRADATPVGELAALTNIYRLVLDSAKKRGRFLDKSGLADGTTTKEDSANVSSLSH